MKEVVEMTGGDFMEDNQHSTISRNAAVERWQFKKCECAFLFEIFCNAYKQRTNSCQQGGKSTSGVLVAYSAGLAFAISFNPHLVLFTSAGKAALTTSRTSLIMVEINARTSSRVVPSSLTQLQN